MAYNPLQDDAQAMALVKKLRICLEPASLVVGEEWHASVWSDAMSDYIVASGPDANRCVCECVAKMQLEEAAA